MRSRARVAGHAIHPMLITFPLGLLSTAVIFDVLYLVTDRPNFTITAGHMIAAGIIGGALAALFGWIDWSKIPAGTRAKRIGLMHAASNAVVLLLFAISWLLRVNAENWAPNGLALTLGFLGLIISGAGAWMGGELVERLGVSIDEGAHVDAPSSLRTENAAGRTSGTTRTAH
jgi:uncharacterized membrane protein